MAKTAELQSRIEELEQAVVKVADKFADSQKASIKNQRDLSNRMDLMEDMLKEISGKLDVPKDVKDDAKDVSKDVKDDAKDVSKDVKDDVKYVPKDVKDDVKYVPEDQPDDTSGGQPEDGLDVDDKPDDGLDDTFGGQPEDGFDDYSDIAIVDDKPKKRLFKKGLKFKVRNGKPSRFTNDGPVRGYVYWDPEYRDWYFTTNFWLARQIAGDTWEVKWVWYEDGYPRRSLTSYELTEYVPVI